MQFTFHNVDWKEINDFIETKSMGLMEHENRVHEEKPTHPKRPYAKARFDPSKGRAITDRDRTFVIVATTVFSHILHSVLPRATEKYPEKFGIESADSVIEAVYDTCPEGRKEHFAGFLRREQFAYIFEIESGAIIDKVLRVDLFRLIELADGNNTDFTGGLFHAFKHFSYKGVPLSTHHENHNIDKPSVIIKHLIDGFFFNEFTPAKGENKLMSVVAFDDKYNLVFVFYLEPNNKVYHIASVSKQGK